MFMRKDLFLVLLEEFFLEVPPLKVIAEELSFLDSENVVSAFGSGKIEKMNLEGKTIKRVFSRGKNLLFECPEYTVRVHFVMFGSAR
jgi:endonuclease VIII